MSERNIGKILLLALAVIGAIALVAVLGMWLMMGGTMMSGGMMNCCGGNMMWGWLVGLLAVAALITAAILLIRRR